MIEESRYCSNVMKTHFNKELVMTKDDNEDFENSTKYWICDNDYIDSDVKIGLSPSKKTFFIHFNNSSLKMIKNSFFFRLKSFFCSQDI